MVRRSRTFGLSVALYAAVIAAGEQRAFSQPLPRLHVVSFTLRTDVRSPHVGQSFHLMIAGRLKERLAEVDFIVLPNLADLEPLGDERRTIASVSGTNFSEVLTVAARRSGAIRVGGAYFDAVDARDGKPKRYYTNDLVLNVGGGVPSRNGSPNSLIAFLATLVGALLLVFVLGKIFLRPRVPLMREAPPAVQPVPAPPNPPENELASALAGLKKDRNRDAVMRLRSALWKTAGAAGGQTLSDVLARDGAPDSLRRSLQTVESAAFIGTARLKDAIEHAIATVERHLS